MKIQELKTKYPFLFPLVSITGVLTVLMLLGFLYVGSLKIALEKEIKTSLEEVARQGVKILQTQIQGDEDSLKSIATAIAGYNNFSQTEMMPLLRKEAKNNSFKRMAFIRPNGFALFSDGLVFDASGQETFQRAIAGRAALSQRFKDSTDGKEIIVQSVPVKQDDQIKGVLTATRSIDLYTEVLSVYSFGGTGYNVIVRANGDKVVNATHSNAIENLKNIFADKENITWHSQKDIEQMQRDMKEGKTGSMLFTTRRGGRVYASYVPIGINDWYMVSVVPEKVLHVRTARLVGASLIFIILGIGLVSLLLFYIVVVRKSNQEAMNRLAYEDPLTGRPNWQKMQQEVKRLLAENPQQSYAFVTLDVDRFRVISHIYGQQSGDNVLKRISQVLAGHMAVGEEFSRMDGDRFQLLLKYKEEDSLRNRLELINEEIINTHISKDPVFRLGLSFGVYLVKERNLSVEEMLNRSFLARRSVKYSVEAVAFFTQEMLEKSNMEKRLEDDMESALKNGEFKLLLLPVKNLKDGRTVRAHGCVVWNHPKLGELQEKDFRPVFERNGFSRQLDMFLLEELFKISVQLRARGREEGPLSITLSPLHIYNPYFPSALKKMAESYRVTADALELDLTQESAEHDISVLIDMALRLHREGFRIGVHRFGEGISAMKFLARVRADCLKICYSRVTQGSDDARAQQIFESFKELASTLDIGLEFNEVQTQAQADFLKRNGVFYASGPLWGKPLAPEEFLKSLD